MMERSKLLFKEILAEEGIPSPSGESEGEDKTNPALLMVEHSACNNIMRKVQCKGLDDKGKMQCLADEVHAELKAWGHPGGEAAL